MINQYVDKNECYGCTSCVNICSDQALSMQPNIEGFLIPELNKELCSNCGKCLIICPVLNHDNTYKSKPNQQFEPIVYAVKHTNDNIRLSSSSGGAYTAISDYILKENSLLKNGDKNSSFGICYGAKFNSDFNVVHTGAKTSKERDSFKGSKYIQSVLTSTFTEIKQNLLDGKTVLYSGTPCQIGGLKNFLEYSKVSDENLFLNDVICHGIASPLLWKHNIQFLENKYKSKLVSFNFRAKEKGGQGYQLKAVFENGRNIIDSLAVKVFIKLYFSHLIMRPSCYTCKYSTERRTADITMGDFWGVEKIFPGFDDEKGVSLVIISSEKGKRIFESIKNDCVVKESNIGECSKFQNNLNRPTALPGNRDKFWNDFLKFGFDYIAKKYGGYNISTKIKKFIKRSVMSTKKIKKTI